MSPELESTIDAARAGDGTALDELCERLYPRVQKIVHQSLSLDVRRKRPWLGALFSTGDVVQEVFIGVMRDIGDVRGRTESSLLHYVATLTRNRLVDSIRFYEASRRDRRRHDARPDPLEAVQAKKAGPEDHAINDEQIARFHRALATFSERDRTLLRERIEHRLPFDQLAEMLGFASADSTRKAFHVAQARLLSRIRSS